MGIYEDRQIHAKTSSRPIKSQGSRSGPHTNRMLYNNLFYSVTNFPWHVQFAMQKRRGTGILGFVYYATFVFIISILTFFLQVIEKITNKAIGWLEQYAEHLFKQVFYNFSVNIGSALNTTLCAITAFTSSEVEIDLCRVPHLHNSQFSWTYVNGHQHSRTWLTEIQQSDWLITVVRNSLDNRQ